MNRVLLLSVLVVLSCGAPAKPVAPTTEATPVAKPAARPDVRGSWKTEGTDFAEITLAADGTFASHLHARPFSTGTWKLVEAGTGYDLVLHSPAAGDQTLRAVQRDKDTLRLEVDANTVVWQRIP